MRGRSRWRTALYAAGLAVVGVVVGGAAGVGVGLVYNEVAHTTSFEGYSAMLVFFGFAPAGMAIGALGVPVAVLTWLGRRSREA